MGSCAGSCAAGEVDPRIFWARLLQRIVIPTVTAFVAVVLGAGALGDERECFVVAPHGGEIDDEPGTVVPVDVDGGGTVEHAGERP